MADPGGQLTVTMAPGGDIDAHELAHLTRQLRSEILETDVDTVEVAATGEPPEGAKGIDVLSWGTLVISFAKSGALRQVVAVIGAFLHRHEEGSITLTLDGDSISVTHATAQEKDRLIGEWIRKHGG